MAIMVIYEAVIPVDREYSSAIAILLSRFFQYISSEE